jgi:hypothetical protein
MPRSLPIKGALSAVQSEQIVQAGRSGQHLFERLLRKIRLWILDSDAVAFWSQSRMIWKNCRPASFDALDDVYPAG